MIVEVKSAQFEAATTEDLQRFGRGESTITIEGSKAVAVKRWEKLNPDRLKYHMIFAARSAIGADQAKEAMEVVEGGES